MKRLTVLSAIALVVSGASICLGEEPVYFADANLKAAVEAALGKANPTPTDMLGLTSLNACCHGITNLTGLEYATNLTYLDLHGNTITDISPLSGLTNLTDLSLSYNKTIADINPLATLTNLTDLTLVWNRIIDISPLAGLNNLTSLWLGHNKITDISPLVGLNNLTQLLLQPNPLNPEACDVYIPLIKMNNPGITLDYGPCITTYSLVISSSDGGSVTTPGEGAFSYANGTVVVVLATPETNYHFVNWTGTAVDAGKVADPNAASTTVTVDGNYTLRANFVATFTILYVDDNAPEDPGPNDPGVSDPNEDGSWEHPFDMIQEAIDVAVDGYTVYVLPGTYYENIKVKGKCISLMSLDPNTMLRAVTNTIINGNYVDTVVTFDSGEDTNCVLNGFTITRGHAMSGGGIYCYGSSPAIFNCLIVGNRAYSDNGGGVLCWDSNATISNCMISGNSAGADGGAFYCWDSDATIANCILWDNWPQEIHVASGALPLMTYSDIQGGWSGLGNIDVDPCFAVPGYWANADDPNIPVEPGEANAIWIEGDYHLKSEGWQWDVSSASWVQDAVTSRCIDAGNPGSLLGDEPISIPDDPNNEWGQNLRINMGAYGGTAEASMPPYNLAILADLTNDGIVDWRDFAYMASDWAAAADEQPGDLDRNGVVGLADLAILAEHWLEGTGP